MDLKSLLFRKIKGNERLKDLITKRGKQARGFPKPLKTTNIRCIPSEEKTDGIIIAQAKTAEQT